MDVSSNLTITLSGFKSSRLVGQSVRAIRRWRHHRVMQASRRLTSVDDLALRVEMVETVQYHLKYDLQDVKRYDVANKAAAVQPQGFPKGLENKTHVLPGSLTDRERVDKLPYKMPALMARVRPSDAL